MRIYAATSATCAQRNRAPARQRVWVSLLQPAERGARKEVERRNGAGERRETGVYALWCGEARHAETVDVNHRAVDAPCQRAGRAQ